MIFRLIFILKFSLGDLNTVERATQAKPLKEDPSEKSIQALARRQRRLDGLQLFEKSKLNRFVKKKEKKLYFSEILLNSFFFDSLIIASKYDSLSILQHLIDYMTLSSHFVIYSQSMHVIDLFII